MVINIGINGLGRIGRAVIRSIYENNYNNIKIKQINSPSAIEDYINLIKYDSVHGKFNENISSDNKGNLIINNQKITKTSYKNIEEITWDEVDIVLECSGKFNSKEQCQHHLNNYVRHVLVSAPCKNADKTIIYGVNHQEINKDNDKIISIGSCTTNCLAPIAKIMHDNVGIEKGFVTTIHAFTNDQRILDNSHKDPRRARACSLSMIPTSTGAAKTIGLIIPQLDGKLDGSAIRVPTPNVSMIDFTFTSSKNTTISEINQIVAKAAADQYHSIIDYLTDPLVSVDMNHTIYSAIFDPYETRVINDNFVRIIAWYDNEWAFSQRMLDVTNLL